MVEKPQQLPEKGIGIGCKRNVGTERENGSLAFVYLPNIIT